MNIEGFYESQGAIKELGGDIDGRVKKAAKMFSKQLGTAHRILDIGCGVGGVALYLKDTLRAGEVYGVEVSEQRVESARERGVKAVQQDLNTGSLPFEDSYFDAIFCGEIIEHLLDPDHLLDEVHRVLTREGVCVLTTPNLAVWYSRLGLLLGWQPFDTSVSYRHEVGRPKFLVSDYGCRDHLRVFTYRALRELLLLKGFNIVEVAGVRMSEVFTDLGDFSTKLFRALIFRAIYPLDAALSLFPSLATRVVVSCVKV